MRKLMLSLVFVLGTATMVNANSSVIEEDGCARDCVNHSLKTIEPMDGQPYHRRMSAYLSIYEICYESNCKE